jgi:hypothetical protein
VPDFVSATGASPATCRKASFTPTSASLIVARTWMELPVPSLKSAFSSGVTRVTTGGTVSFRMETTFVSFVATRPG